MAIRTYCFPAQASVCSAGKQESGMASDFPLAQWFDILKPISRDDRELAEA